MSYEWRDHLQVPQNNAGYITSELTIKPEDTKFLLVPFSLSSSLNLISAFNFYCY